LKDGEAYDKVLVYYMGWKKDLLDCINNRITVIANCETHTGTLEKIGAKSIFLKNVIYELDSGSFLEKKEKKKFEVFDWVKIPLKDIEFIKSAPTDRGFRKTGKISERKIVKDWNQ